MKKPGILKMIREEVEVVLTNEEAIEMFDLDPAALLDEMMVGEAPLEEKKKKKKKKKKSDDDDWIGDAVNPKHKGYCTPMTKKTCTAPRKRLAKIFKGTIRKSNLKKGKNPHGPG